MSRAHFYRPVQDERGDLKGTLSIRLLEPGTTTPIDDPIRTMNEGPSIRGNPWTAPESVVDFYLDTPRVVRIGVTPEGAQETYFEDMEVGAVVSVPVAAEPYLLASGEGVITDGSVDQSAEFTTAVRNAADLGKVLVVDGTVLLGSLVTLTGNVRIQGLPGSRLVIGHGGAGLSIGPVPESVGTVSTAAVGATTVDLVGGGMSVNAHAGKWLEITDPAVNPQSLDLTMHRIPILSNTDTTFTLARGIGYALPAGCAASVVTPISTVRLEDLVIDRSVPGAANLTITYVTDLYENNLSVRNSGNYSTVKGNAISHYQCSKIRSYNLEVIKAGNFGIFVYNCDDVRFHNPTVTGFAGQFGLQLKDNRDAKVYGGHVYGDGVKGDSAYNVKCSGLNAAWTQHLIDCYGERSRKNEFEFSTIQNEGSGYVGTDFLASKCTSYKGATTGFATIVDAATVDIDKQWRWEDNVADGCGQVGFVPSTGMHLRGNTSINTGFEGMQIGSFTVMSGADESAYYPYRDITVEDHHFENCCTAYASGTARSAYIYVVYGALRNRFLNCSSLRNRAGDKTLRILREAQALTGTTGPVVLAKPAPNYTELVNWKHVDVAAANAFSQDVLLFGANSRAVGSGSGDSYLGTPVIYKYNPTSGIRSAPVGTDTQNVTKVTADAVLAAGLGVPLILVGTFSINDTISLPANLTVDLSRATITQTTSLRSCFTVTGANTTILGGTLQGKTTDYVNNSSVYGACAISVAGTASDTQVIGVRMLGWAGAGVHVLDPAGNVLVRDCTITGAGSTYITATTFNFSAGIRMLSVTGHLTANNNDISGFAQGIITSIGASRLVITNNRIHDIPGQHGLYIESVSRCVVTGNIIWNTGILGMKIQMGSLTDPEAVDAVISNNVFMNTGGQAILLTNTAGVGGSQVRRVLVMGNVLDGCGNGIEGTNLDAAIISNNVINNSTNRGIYLHELTNVQVFGNQIQTCVAQGIFLENATNMWVRDNRVVNPGTGNGASTEFGIHTALTCSEIVIENNRVTDTLGNMRYGFYLNHPALDSLTFRDNYTTGATDHGVRMNAIAAVREWANNDLNGGIGKMNAPPSSGRGNKLNEFFGTAAPTTGLSAVGDLVWNTVPTAGGNMGWVCTTGGNPGTWKTFGTIAP